MSAFAAWRKVRASSSVESNSSIVSQSCTPLTETTPINKSSSVFSSSCSSNVSRTTSTSSNVIEVIDLSDSDSEMITEVKQQQKKTISNKKFHQQQQSKQQKSKKRVRSEVNLEDSHEPKRQKRASYSATPESILGFELSSDENNSDDAALSSDEDEYIQKINSKQQQMNDEYNSISVSNTITKKKKKKKKTVFHFVDKKKKPQHRRLKKNVIQDSDSEDETYYQHRHKSDSDESEVEEEEEVPDQNKLTDDFYEFFDSGAREFEDEDDEEETEISTQSSDSLSTVLPRFKRRKTDSINKNGVLPKDLQADAENEWLYDSTGQRFILQLPNKSVFEMDGDIFNKLYGYQRDGVQWLITRHASKEFQGGILADDMGLGKTIQICAYMNGAVQSDLAYRFLIVAPVSVVHNWSKEIAKWAPNIRHVIIFHKVTSENTRSKVMNVFTSAKAKNDGLVMITTYGTIRSQSQLFTESFSSEFIDCIILDEGHSIKNSNAKVSQVLQGLKSKSKFILTGTPIMNKLSEMWSLFDWIFDGELLGSKSEFKSTYEHPIVKSTKRDASASCKIHGNELSVQLRQLIQPYFLRREKDIVLKTNKDMSSDAGTVKQSVRAQISQKNDLVLWICMTQEQEEVYREFVGSSEVKAVLNKCENALGALSTLKSICDHHVICPKCTKFGAIPDMKIGDGGNYTEDQIKRMRQEHEDRCIQQRINKLPIKTLIKESGKMKVIKELLLQHKQNGDRTLIFSQYKRMLNVIERLLKEDLKFKYERIDGQVTDAKERTRRVDNFNSDPSITAFLLTTGCGSVGLTLTGANRVILVDPSWNPAVDGQAVDRVYRIGQTRNVVVYRLINCSSIEEKIYRKQIFKFNLSKTAIEKENNYRYFSDDELQQLFILGNTKTSDTQQLLYNLHHSDRNTYEALEDHIEWITNLDDVFGISHHDMLFHKAADDLDEEDMDDEMYEKQYGISRYMNKNNREQLMTALQQLDKQKQST
jgi:SNF2 family DNA or RNA helicase